MIAAAETVHADIDENAVALLLTASSFGEGEAGGLLHGLANAVIDIFETNDVIFAKIASRLYFDHG